MRFHQWWLRAGVAAALAAASGCEERNRNRSPGEQVVDAQKQSEDVLKRAEQAQRKATDEQKDAARAQEDVQRAQQRLTEQQAKAQKETQQAQQAQQQAQQEAQKASGNAQQAQQSAIQAQQSQQQQYQQSQQQYAQGQVAANPQGAAKSQSVDGVVVQANPSELVLKTSSDPQLRLKVSGTTAVTVNGQQGSVDQLQEGNQVRASYQLVDGQATAVKIDAAPQQAQPLPQPPQ